MVFFPPLIELGFVDPIATQGGASGACILSNVAVRAALG
jgi:hypothetical protein